MISLDRGIEEINKDIKKFEKHISKLKLELKEIKTVKTIKLNPARQSCYNSIIQMYNSPLGKKICKEIPFKNEKEYLIFSITTEIKEYENFLKQTLCEKQGHVNKLMRGGHNVYCDKCGADYYKRETQEELDSWYNFARNALINTQNDKRI